MMQIQDERLKAKDAGYSFYPLPLAFSLDSFNLGSKP